MFLKSQSSLFVLAVAMFGLVLSGCGGGGEEAAGSPEATGTPAPSPSESSAAGTSGIAGKVTYEGTPPERSVLETAGDPKCAAMHESAPLLSDREVVSADGGVRWAFVYLKDAPEGDYAVPTDEVMLDQVGCQYTPHVLGVRVGQTLSLHNSDALLHNVRAITRNRANKPINYSQPAGTPPRTKVFESAEMEIRMKCDVHPWMTAYVFALDHPFFAVTDENGAFSIEGVPAGEYTLVMWHEAYGEQEVTVTVSSGQVAEASFTVKPAE